MLDPSPRLLALIPKAIAIYNPTHTTHKARWLVRSMLAFTIALSSTLAHSAENKPYDEKLYRLAEILGAVHYLRELCDADDGQQWRDQMKGLLTTEGSTALRRAHLTRSFNSGYRSYSRTYVNCTPSAKTAISRFLTEGVEISEGLLKATP